MAFGADKYNSSKEGEEGGLGEQEKLLAEFTAVEIYRELIREQQGQAGQSPPEIEKRNKMKNYLKETVNTDKIE